MTYKNILLKFFSCGGPYQLLALSTADRCGVQFQQACFPCPALMDCITSCCCCCCCSNFFLSFPMLVNSTTCLFKFHCSFQWHKTSSELEKQFLSKQLLVCNIVDISTTQLIQVVLTFRTYVMDHHPCTNTWFFNQCWPHIDLILFR